MFNILIKGSEEVDFGGLGGQVTESNVLEWLRSFFIKINDLDFKCSDKSIIEKKTVDFIYKKDQDDDKKNLSNEDSSELAVKDYIIVPVFIATWIERSIQ